MAIVPIDSVPCQHQDCMPTEAHCLPTMGYPYYLHPAIRSRSFHCQPHQPRATKTKWMGVILEGFGWSWPRMDLRMEPALPHRKRPVKFGQLLLRKRPVQPRQLLPRTRPVSLHHRALWETPVLFWQRPPRIWLVRPRQLQPGKRLDQPCRCPPGKKPYNPREAYTF